MHPGEPRCACWLACAAMAQTCADTQLHHACSPPAHQSTLHGTCQCRRLHVLQPLLGHPIDVLLGRVLSPVITFMQTGFHGPTGVCRRLGLLSLPALAK